MRVTVATEVESHRTKKLDSTMTNILGGLECDTCRTILQGKETGQWLSVMPSNLNGTELSAQEFRDALLLHHAKTPGNLTYLSDGFGAKFDIHHAL
jgi:hypothetical protein